jgi:hypothetical protein
MQAHPARRVNAARFHVALVVLAALATLGFPGCPEEDVTGPGGGGSPTALTMSNCWPNDDQRYWTYATTYRDLADEAFTYVPEGQPPATVSLDVVRRLLDDSVPQGTGAIQYLFGLHFDGMKTTHSGVTAQNLVESFPPITTAGAAIPFAAEDRLLARIAEARPDLRARIEARRPGLLARLRLAGPIGGGVLLPRGPEFIFGYAWIKTPAWIGTYGDADTLPAWRFLEADVHPGHQFTHQLVPSLASDVWLRASVERKTTVVVPGGRTVSNALEVLYLVDYGVSSATDETGNVIGSFRAFDYGTVIYAPGVGPARVHERHMGMAGMTRTHGMTELELTLQATGLPIRGPLAATAR